MNSSPPSDRQHRPTITVILPAPRSERALRAALDSVLAQTRTDFEVVVVGCRRAQETELATCDPRGRVRFIPTPAHRRPAMLLNAGLQAAQGRYIAYLDAGDLFYVHHLETLVGFLDRSGHRVAYSDACRAHHVQDGGEVTVIAREPQGFDFDADRLLLESYINLSTVVHEASCLDEVGRFDELLECCEAWDLWIRLSRRCAFARVSTTTCEVSRIIAGPGNRGGAALVEALEAENKIRVKYREWMAASRYAPLFYPYLAERINLLRDLGVQRETLAILEGFLEYGPNHSCARIELAYLHSLAGNPGRGAAVLRAAGLGASESARRAASAVEELTRLGRLEDAERLQEKLLLDDPMHADGLNNLGVLAWHRGDKPKARALLWLAVELEPENLQAVRNLASVCRELGSVAEAARVHTMLLRLDPHDPEALQTTIRLAEPTSQSTAAGA